MNKGLAYLSLCLLCARWGVCQQSSSSAGPAAAPNLSQPQTPVGITQSVQVTTTVEPLPLAESNRSVLVIQPREALPGTDSVVDLLRTDPSLNLQARAGEGVQADLAIRGATFEQSLVLVNGLRVDDPETGHLNLDIPVPLDAITRVDVLHGSGSTFYGSDAIGGAVNLLTGAPAAGLSVVARSGAGNYGSLEEHLRAAYSSGPFAEQLTGSRDTSDGFIADRNYSSNALASESWLKTKPGTTDVLLAASDRPYGANQFYGPYNSWERTKAWLASIQQQFGKQTAASFGYLRHSDRFVLLQGLPAIYENNHITTSYEGALRRADELGRNSTLAYGLEESGDSIRSFNFSENSSGGEVLSNALGVHARNQGAGYANLSMSALGRFSLSTRRARRGSLRRHLGLLPQCGRSLHADQNRAPARLGRAWLPPAHLHRSLLLRPGHGRQSLSQAGVQLELRGRPRLEARQWPADAHGGRLPPARDQRHRLLKTVAADPRRAVEGRQRAHAGHRRRGDQHARAASAPPSSSTSAIRPRTPATCRRTTSRSTPSTTRRRMRSSPGPDSSSRLSAHTQVNVVQKTTQTAYPLWDASLARNTGSIRPYLRLLNLSNTGYTEIVGVPMQGRTIMGGMEWSWRGR